MPIPEPYRRLQEIAPRLGRAWKDEQAYQARLAERRADIPRFWLRGGYVTQAELMAWAKAQAIEEQK